MNESIFKSMKRMLDLEETTSFDTDIKFNINAALDTLRQNGVGAIGLYIETGEETWEDFLMDPTNLAHAQTFVYARIKPVIDGTISGTYVNTLKQIENESLWRCHAEHDR